MKRLGLLLLAVVMVAGLAGCPKGDDSITFTLALNANCGSSGFARGTISNVETGYQTETISIDPGQSLIIKLPEAGLYRFTFTNGNWYWDYTRTINDGDYSGLNCSK
jgi:hypothetical protein